MTIAPYFCVVSGIIGCVSGVAAGAQSSGLLAIVGGFAGLLIGIASFVVFTVPYVAWMIRWEGRQALKSAEPPRVWGLLFLPVMIASVLTAAIVPFFIFRSN